LPVEIAPSDAAPLAAEKLDAEALAERASRSVVKVELDTHAVKSASEYGRDVEQSFLGFILNPFTLPAFLLETLFGWLDFAQRWGSGFIVDTAGHVVTNAHVVADEREVTIERADRLTFRAKVIAVDAGRDLALLRIELGDATLLPADVMPLGSSSGVRLGQKAVIYGFPTRPWDQDLPIPTVTAGIVSSVGIDVGERAKRIQLDAAANHGSSGSPVLDEHGAAIGVVTEAAENMESQTFAIPIDDVIEAFFKRTNDGHPH
jgi:S1-C subfamily serine protease